MWSITPFYGWSLTKQTIQARSDTSELSRSSVLRNLFQYPSDGRFVANARLEVIDRFQDILSAFSVLSPPIAHIVRRTGGFLLLRRRSG